jgi:hypothetical protein
MLRCLSWCEKRFLFGFRWLTTIMQFKENWCSQFGGSRIGSSCGAENGRRVGLGEEVRGVFLHGRMLRDRTSF